MEINISMYARVDDWKWFEVRDLSHFLRFFRPIFQVLKDTGLKVTEQKAFDEFWEQCKNYLKKIGHNNIDVLMYEDGDFKRGAWNYWTKMHQKQTEGLPYMFKVFKACFGIRGNDDHCQVKYGESLNYSWKKMADCTGALEVEREEFKMEKRDARDYEWSERGKDLIAEAKKRLQGELE